MSKETHRFLKQNPEIIILKADKGNVTVAMDKSEYLEKSYQLLSDTNTYIQLNNDPTISIQNKLNKLLDQLILARALTKEESKKLKCNNGVFPKMYLLPKIHKNNIPLRPIVSFIGSPVYQLTKYLSKLINYAFDKDEFYTKNSFEIVTHLQGFQIPPNYVLVSLDVVSLFTNIPTDLTIKILTERWDSIKDHCSLTLSQLVQLLNFTFENSYFNFENKFYKQVFGLGMGNCMSPACSDLIMSVLQKECINKLPFKLPFFKRYVDDIVTCVPANQVDILLNTFNSYHPRLQFTIELEHNNAISFLDVLIIRSQENVIRTDWYHKPTFSERFLNFNSYHSFQQKINIIKNLKNRALRLSHPDYHRKNLLSIKRYLIKNEYPHRLINKILFKTDNQRKTNVTKQQNRYCKIPYVQNLSERLARDLRDDNISIAFKNENTTKRLFSKLKTPTPRDLESNVIYKIPCSQCEGVYIGQTSRYLKTRISEHKRSIKPHVLLNSNSKTALAEHFERYQHPFTFEDTEILSRQSNYKKRLISEMVEIKKHKHNINKKQDVEKLSVSYFNIIQKIQ